jgi:HlyD family secretion protein
MSRKWWMVLLALVAGSLVAAAAWFYRVASAAAASEPKDVITVQRIDFPLVVNAPGLVEAAKSVSIGPPQIRHEHRFKLARMVEEGTQVSEGDFLVEFDGSDISRRLRDDTANFQRVQQEYQKKRSDSDIVLRDLKLTLEQAKADLEKLDNKLSQQVELASAIEIAETRLRQVSARTKVALLEKKVGYVSESQRLDLQISRSNETHYRNHMNTLLDAMDALTVTAPVAGVVIYKRDWNNEPRQVGSYVWMLDTVMEIPDLSTLRAKVLVDEVDAGKVKPGQSAQVTVDAVQGKVFTGKVSYVSAILKQAAYDRPQKVVECFVDFDSSGVSQVRPGMSTRALIQVGKREKAIVIPLTSIQERDGRSFVQVWQSRKKEFEWREIQLASNDGVSAVVQEGLEANEQIRSKPKV